MTDQLQEPNNDASPEADSPSDAPPPGLAAGGGKLQFAPPDAPTAPLPPREKRPPPQPTLRCPFCSGRRFDFGRDLYAGAEALLYCRRTPAPGRRPEDVLSLPMKAAVCLDCGYVATMVDIAHLNAPIRKPGEAAVLGQTADAPGDARARRRRRGGCAVADERAGHRRGDRARCGRAAGGRDAAAAGADARRAGGEVDLSV